MQGESDLVQSRGVDIWLGRAAIVGVVALQAAMINNFALGPRWLLPLIECALLVPLTLLSLRNQRLAPKGGFTSDDATFRARRRRIMHLGFVLLAVVSAANARALAALIHALLAGRVENGTALLLDAMNIWATNVIVFALWYWELDRGGPSARAVANAPPSDYIFAQATLDRMHPAAGRASGFIDYLFLSFTTSTSLAPADTLPLTWRMKLLMMLQASISLLTIALVAARAVNILA